MKRCCLILLMLVALCVQAQSPKGKSKVAPPDSVQEVYKGHLLIGRYEYRNGQKNGEFSELFYSSLGELIFKEEGKFKNGLKQGRAKIICNYDNELLRGPDNYYLNGKLQGFNTIIEGTDTMLTAKFEKGIINGRITRSCYSKFYDNTGYKFSKWQTVEECEYKNGVKHGFGIFLVKNSVIEQFGYYKNGLKDSIWNAYITHGEYRGEILQKVNYVKGIRQGPSEGFYRPYKEFVDGDSVWKYDKITEYSEYKDDVLHGEYFISNSKGQEIESGTYVEGKRQGKLRYLFPYGGLWLMWEGNVVDDKMEGSWNSYDAKRRLLIKANFKNDLPNGLWQFYNDKKVKVVEKLFLDGHVMSIKNFQELQNLSSVVISKLSKDAMRLNVELVLDYRTSLINYQYVGGDTMPVLDTIAMNYFDMRNGDYNDTVLKLDGKHLFYSHDTLMLIQNYTMGKLDGAHEYYDYAQGIKVVNLYEKDSMVSELFYTLDGKPFSGVYEMMIETPPNREVIQVRKGRRHGYTYIYGRLTGRLIGRVKYSRHAR